MSKQEKLAKFIRVLITHFLIGYVLGMLIAAGVIIWVSLT